MTAIMGFAELLLNLESSDSPKRAWMERIYKNSQMLSAIVEDMLNVSRIQSGKLALNLERLDLAGAPSMTCSSGCGHSPRVTCWWPRSRRIRPGSSPTARS